MVKGPEKVIFDEPELQSGFFGRKYFSPPKKAPHFFNLQFKEHYNVTKAHVIVNPYSGKKKGITVGMRKFLPYPALTLTKSPGSPNWATFSNNITSMT